MPECCVSDCKSGRKKTAKNPEPEKVQMFLVTQQQNTLVTMFPRRYTRLKNWKMELNLGKRKENPN